MEGEINCFLRLNFNRADKSKKKLIVISVELLSWVTACSLLETAAKEGYI